MKLVFSFTPLRSIQNFQMVDVMKNAAMNIPVHFLSLAIHVQLSVLGIFVQEKFLDHTVWIFKPGR